MTYYVMSDMGIEEEFDSFEEADNYIDMNGNPSMLWISTEHPWEMMDDIEREEYFELLREIEDDYD